MTLLYNLFCRRDWKSLKNYDFLWEVMEENIRKNNKVSKPAWVFSSPPGLVDLCFSVLRREKVVHRVLDPLKVQKTNSSTNTDDDDDDTISMMSFQDPVDFDDSLEEDMNLDNILQPPFIGPVLPHYVPPVPTPVIGAKLLGTNKNSLLVYDPPPWIPRPMELYVKSGMEGLFSRPFDYIPTPSLEEFGVSLPTLDELSSLLKVWKEKYAAMKGETQLVPIIENSSNGTSPTDAEMDDDSSLEETYFRLPEPLKSSVADVCSMETSEKVVHVIFDLDKIKNQSIAGVKVDVNFNCPGEKRHATPCCDRSWKRLKREK